MFDLVERGGGKGLVAFVGVEVRFSEPFRLLGYHVVRGLNVGAQVGVALGSLRMDLPAQRVRGHARVVEVLLDALIPELAAFGVREGVAVDFVLEQIFIIERVQVVFQTVSGGSFAIGADDHGPFVHVAERLAAGGHGQREVPHVGVHVCLFQFIAGGVRQRYRGGVLSRGRVGL